MLCNGNAQEEGLARGGWFFGWFMNDARHNMDVELKWAEHPAGTAREDWSPPSGVSTVTMLVRGRFVLLFDGGREVVLEREGDYAFWGPGEGHGWRCEEDCELVTVRWPSGPPG